MLIANYYVFSYWNIIGNDYFYSLSLKSAQKDMMEKDKKTESIDATYLSPQTKVLFIKSQGVLCLSGNEPMREHDYGNGGFSEE